MKYTTNQEHITKAFLVGARVKRATYFGERFKSVSGYGLFMKQYRSIPSKQKLL